MNCPSFYIFLYQRKAPLLLRFFVLSVHNKKHRQNACVFAVHPNNEQYKFKTASFNMYPDTSGNGTYPQM